MTSGEHRRRYRTWLATWPFQYPRQTIEVGPNASHKIVLAVEAVEDGVAGIGKVGDRVVILDIGSYVFIKILSTADPVPSGASSSCWFADSI